MLMKSTLMAATVLASTAALADYQITPMLGHTVLPSNTQKHQTIETGGSAHSNEVWGVGVGKDMTDRLNMNFEYNYNNAAGRGAATKSKTEDYAVNVRYTVVPQYRLYTLGGLGYTKITTNLQNGKDGSESPIVQFGVGKQFKTDDRFTVKTEVKGVYNTNNNFWTPTAMVGLDINFK